MFAPRSNHNFHGCPRLRRRRTFTAWLSTLWLTLAVPIGVAAAGDPRLAGDRWREEAHGLSLSPPRGAQASPLPAEDGLVRFLGPGESQIEVFLKHSTADLTIDGVLDEAVRQFAMACPSAKILKQNRLAVSDLTGGVLYFAVPDRKRSLLVGQAFVLLNPRQIVMLQLTHPLDAHESAVDVFEAVLASLLVQDPAQLNEFRAQRIAHGEAWRQTIRPDRLRAVTPAKQWFRIVDDHLDVGYMRLQTRRDEQLGQPGALVETDAHWTAGPNDYDVNHQAFASDDGTYEAWSVRTAVRRTDPASAYGPPPSDRPQDVSVWAQTGVRIQDKITLTFDGPAGRKELRWRQPPRGYLSQVHLLLLGPLLAGQDSAEFGFYAYSPNVRKLAFRTDRLVRSPDGSYTVYSKPSPELEEQTAFYNPDGRLIRRELPTPGHGKQVILPTTEAQLATLWKIR